jgi:hypothetical protein
MKTGSYLAAVLFVAFFGAAANADTISLSKLATQVQKPSVQILMADGGACSGTIVMSSRDSKTGIVKTAVLTAEHCVKETPYRNFEIVFPVYNKDGLVVEKNIYLGEVGKQGSDTNDLAIITLKDTATFFGDYVAKVAARLTNPQFGEQVWTSGYALGRDLGVTEGRFNSREEFNFPDNSHETTFFRASPPIAPGNSGGGMFHLNASGDFELIGVSDWVAGGQGGPSTFGAYTPIDRVYDFLSDWDSTAFPKAAAK